MGEGDYKLKGQAEINQASFDFWGGWYQYLILLHLDVHQLGRLFLLHSSIFSLYYLTWNKIATK